MAKEKQEILTVTNTLLKFNGQNFQLRNLTQFGKFKAEPPKKKGAGWAFLSTLLGFFLCSNDDARGFGILLALVSSIVLVSRLRKPKVMYAMRIETSAGSGRLFQTYDERSVDQTIAALQAGMERRIGDSPRQVTIHNPVFGDNIEGNTGTVVSRSSGVGVR